MVIDVESGTICRCHPGATVWPTGLPSAGKPTTAHSLVERLRREHRRVAEAPARDDVLVPVSRTAVPKTAPYADSRAAVRKRQDKSVPVFLEVLMTTRVEVCSVRDVQGLYARQAPGGLSGFTGVDDPHEAPGHPDVVRQTHRHGPPESGAALYGLLSSSGPA